MIVVTIFLLSIIFLASLSQQGVAVVLACGQNITNTSVLTANVGSCSGDGVIVAGASVMLDCDGFDILGDSSNSTSIGIIVDSSRNITIRNCNVTGFDRGLVVNTTWNSSFFNSTFVSYNLDRGMHLIRAKNNTFYNVTGRSNSSHGIELDSSGNNTFILFEGHSTSGRGIYSGSGEGTGNLNRHNLFINVTGNSSSGMGIDTLIGDNQTFIDCYANSTSSTAFRVGDHINITRGTVTAISGFAFDVDSGNDNNYIEGSTVITLGGANLRPVLLGGTNNTLVNLVLYKLGGTGAVLDIVGGDNNTITNVTTYENVSVIGLRIQSGENNSIISSNIHSTTVAIRLDTNPNRNFFNNTFINTSGSTAILVRSSINTTFNDVSINMTSLGRALLVDTNSNHTVIDGFLLTNVFNITVDSTSNLSARNVTFFNGNGSLHFQNFTVNIGTGFDTAGNLSITFNRTFVNSSSLPQLNVSAKIVLFNVSANLNLSNITVMYDPEDDGTYIACPATTCTEDTYNSTTGDYTFNVTGFTTYVSSVNESANAVPPSPGGEESSGGGGGGSRGQKKSSSQPSLASPSTGASAPALDGNSAAYESSPGEESKPLDGSLSITQQAQQPVEQRRDEQILVGNVVQKSDDAKKIVIPMERISLLAVLFLLIGLGMGFFVHDVLPRIKDEHGTWNKKKMWQVIKRVKK